MKLLGFSCWPLRAPGWLSNRSATGGRELEWSGSRAVTLTQNWFIFLETKLDSYFAGWWWYGGVEPGVFFPFVRGASDEAFPHFASFWRDGWAWGPLRRDLPGPLLSEEDSSWLARPIEKWGVLFSWNYVEAVLHSLGFPDIWIKWTLGAISSPSYTFSINGKRSDWVSANSGIRQGCPLSPYLFTFCTEVLSRLLLILILIRVLEKEGTQKGY